MVFKSKIGWVIFLPVFLLLASTALLSKETLLVNLLCALFIVVLFLKTSYTIQGDVLIVRSWFLVNTHIAIADIKSVKKTRNPLSAPAFSLDRLAISYGKFDYVLISPEDRQQFIAALLQRNSAITVQH